MALPLKRGVFKPDSDFKMQNFTYKCGHTLRLKCADSQLGMLQANVYSRVDCPKCARKKVQ